MTRSILILASICLIAAIAGITAIACAQMEENWDPMQKLDQIGNPAAQEPNPQAFGPAVARLTNSQFSREEAQNNSASNSNTANAEENAEQTPAPVINIDLRNISAMPNPANAGSPVEITASLSNVENMTAYAIIQNSMGVRVSNVTLERSSGGDYVGTWNAGIATGIYSANIVASAPGTSKTFNNALQIEVKESADATSSSDSETPYTKLG
ncbi:MAG: hypothetical protein ACE14P_06090 [Methanotrichaceae archaeon]